MPKILVLEDDLVTQLLQQLPASGHQAIAALRASLVDADEAGASQTLPISANASPARSSRTQTAVGLNPTVSSSHLAATPTQAFAAPHQTRQSRHGRSQSLPPLGELMVLDSSVWSQWSPRPLPCITEEFSSSSLLSADNAMLPCATTVDNSPQSTSDTQANSNGKRPGSPLPEAPLAKKKKAASGSASRKEAGAGAGAGGGGGNGNAKKCPRKGDGGCVGGDDDIGQMDGDGDCPACGGDHGPNVAWNHPVNAGAGGVANGEGEGDGDGGRGRDGDDGDGDGDGDGDDYVDDEGANKATKKKNKKTKMGFNKNGKGPPLTKDAGQLLGDLAAVFQREKRTQLDALLDGLGQQEEEIDPDEVQDLTAVIKRLDVLNKKSQATSLWHMIALVQLVMHVYSIREDCRKKYLHVPGKQAIAEQYAGSNRSTFTRRFNQSTRLMLLCAASSPYILVIIAALKLEDDFTSRKKSTDKDIMAVASAFREMSDDKWGPLVNRLRVPLEYIRTKATFLNTSVNFFYRVPQGMGSPPQTRRIPFHSLIETDEIFETVDTNCPKLAPRSSCWYKPVPVWTVFSDPKDFALPDVHTIRTDDAFEKTKCPVNRNTTDVFTEEQRAIAEDAEIAENLDHLEDLINEKDRDGYIEIKSSILGLDDPQSPTVLRIEDQLGKLLSELFTLPGELRQRLEDAITLIQAAMPGEWIGEDSKRLLYSYLSCHYSWYSRYGEKGHDAPQDAAHMDNIQRDHEGRTNFGQRIPHESKEMLENLKEFAILAEAYTDIFEYIRIVLQERFPDEYQDLSIYCDVLPMNPACPSYPFGGFVLNLRASTWAHRDHGDKMLCVVIPFGRYTGGQLCLYEVGFMFDLQAGDVLIFPSCDITHFNMHFTGKRGTLVLHSDRQGDAWVRDCRGWAGYISRTTIQ
ncbi:hypothetical protein C8R47DRAFT_1319303 [Mycena vitilis]|nr:hypothetical protein C8R47DRAFT_1319303 [Mycena vitilis]